MPLNPVVEKDGVLGKVCPCCKEWRILPAWGRTIGTKDGLSCYCKDCDRAKREHNKEKARKRASEWYYANMGRARARMRDYNGKARERRKNPPAEESSDEIAREYAEHQMRAAAHHQEYHARWREEHRKYNRARAHKRWIENRESETARINRWLHENRTRVRAKQKALLAAHPERRRIYGMRWYWKDRDRARELAKKCHMARPLVLRVAGQNRRARKLGVGGTLITTEVEVLLAAQEHACFYCGEKLEHVYEIEHKIPLSRGGTNHIDNVCLCCYECNRQKNTKTAVEFMAHLRRLHAYWVGHTCPSCHACVPGEQLPLFV